MLAAVSSPGPAVAADWIGYEYPDYFLYFPFFPADPMVETADLSGA